MREFCASHCIKYAPWGILCGSPDLLEGVEARDLANVAEEMGATKHVAFLASLQNRKLLGGCEVSILCGTKRRGRKRETMTGLWKIRQCLGISQGHRERWAKLVEKLSKVIRAEEAR